jgi:quercetin 2,3-dioxygenase
LPRSEPHRTVTAARPHRCPAASRTALSSPLDRTVAPQEACSRTPHLLGFRPVKKQVSRRQLLAALPPAALLVGVGSQAMTAKPMQTAPTPTAPRAKVRPVDFVVPPPRIHWVGDGFRVHGYMSAFPDAMLRLSPFLMLDYHAPFVYEGTEKPRGVGVHPHRGFETVTIAWEGSIAHHDSTGAGGIIGPGDVQWMTAASGILHKEYHEDSWAKQGGRMHMAQLWVNLPRSHKMVAPGYQPITGADMGVVDLGGGSRVRIIAGEYAGVRGPARTVTKVTMLDVRLTQGAVFEVPCPARENLAVLVMAGEVAVNGEARAGENSFVVFKNEGELATLAAAADAHLLVLGGEPIEEPIASYGPFVMNTREEIAQAYEDFRRGKFGFLAD